MGSDLGHCHKCWSTQLVFGTKPVTNQDTERYYRCSDCGYVYEFTAVTHPNNWIANLERQLAACQAELEQTRRERDTAREALSAVCEPDCCLGGNHLCPPEDSCGVCKAAAGYALAEAAWEEEH